MKNFPSDILTDIRKHLEEEKKQVMVRIDELSAQDPFTNPDRVNDNASDADANEESSHDRFAAMVDELKVKRNSIDAALMRIGAGTYGFCSVCGDMIDTDRLAILPTAILCLRHEKERAQGKKTAS